MNIIEILGKLIGDTKAFRAIILAIILGGISYSGVWIELNYVKRVEYNANIEKLTEKMNNLEKKLEHVTTILEMARK
jgi:hypothetical protein